MSRIIVSKWEVMEATHVQQHELEVILAQLLSAYWGSVQTQYEGLPSSGGHNRGLLSLWSCFCPSTVHRVTYTRAMLNASQMCQLHVRSELKEKGSQLHCGDRPPLYVRDLSIIGRNCIVTDI